MDKLSVYILQETLYYLDFTSLNECRAAWKKFYTLTNQSYFWKSKYSLTHPSTFHSGPYFKFPKLSSIINSLHFPEPIQNYSQLIQQLKKLANPKKLSILSIEASSEDYDQVATSVLEYDGKFWSSLPSQSDTTDEFLIIKLKESSLIFTVNFKVYRATYQGGIIYPPKFVKVFIGTAKDTFHYESEEFEVGLTENYNTVCVLPEVVEGQFVKILCIGKKMRETGSEKWYTVLRFVEVVGYQEAPDLVLEECIAGNFKDSHVDLQHLGPFHLERLENYQKINEYYEAGNYSPSDLNSYFAVVYGLGSRGHCELLGNYFMDKGEFDEARKCYMRIGDVWGYSKACLKLRRFDDVKRLISETDIRQPNKAWILKTAKELGGTALEEELIQEIDPEPIDQAN